LFGGVATARGKPAATTGWVGRPRAPCIRACR